MLRRLVGAAALAGLLGLAACTPAPTETSAPTPPVTSPAVTPRPSVTPTPTETMSSWSAEQQAAVDTVEKWFGIYNAVMLGQQSPNDLVLAGRGEVVEEAHRTYNDFVLAELTVEGEITIAALEPGEPSEASNEDRRAVLVDLCQDMTGWSVLDEDGKDTLTLDSKVVRPLVATVEEWPKDGWFVTSISGGKQKC